MTDPTTPAPGENPSGGPSPASAPSGVASSNPTSESASRTTGRIKVRAINQIVHDGQTLTAGTIFSGEAKDINPLLEMGAVEHYPPRTEDSAQARAQRAVAAREAQARETGKPEAFKVEDEVPSTGTPQAKQAESIRSQVADDARLRASLGSLEAEKTDNFGRPVPLDRNDRVADAAAEIANRATKQAEQSAKDASRVAAERK